MLRKLLKPSNNKFTINGTVLPKFQPVATAFETLFTEGYDKNSQLCIYVEGEKVLDLFGSTPDIRNSQKFTADSLTTIYSNSKTVASLLMAKLYQQGLFEYGDLVTKHWPEFGKNGKGNLKIADVLRHEAGLSKLGMAIKPEWTLTENVKENFIGKIIEEDI